MQLKATHTEFIFVFPLQQYLHERTTTLHYTYTAYLLRLYSHLRLGLASVLILSRLPTKTLNAPLLPLVFMKNYHLGLQTELPFSKDQFCSPSQYIQCLSYNMNIDYFVQKSPSLMYDG